MERMRGMLCEAAREGNTQTLLELLRQDPLILDKFITSYPMSDTPLHIAAMLGHTDFVKEILNTKPELVRELNSERSSPLHLASAKGYVEVVKALALVDSNVCLVHDAKGRNPLHLAAMKGHLEVLRVLVRANRDAVRATMGSGGENILHVAVKCKQLRSLEQLVGDLGDDHQFLNAKDNYGMTILHRAVLAKQVEIINFLLMMNTRMEVNAINANGFTALDILKQSERDVRDFEIGESLRIAGAITSSTPQLRPPEILPLPSDPNIPIETTNPQTQLATDQEAKKMEEDRNWLIEKRESLMVVASLLATMAFQAMSTPPGGLWQDDSEGNPITSHVATSSPAPISADGQYHTGHLAGSSIMAVKYKSLYNGFIICNTIGFLASLSIILLLVTGLTLKLKQIFLWLLTAIMWVAITAMALAYMIIFFMVSTVQGDPSTPGSHTYVNINGHNIHVIVRNVMFWSFFAWFLVMLNLLFHTIRTCR